MERRSAKRKAPSGSKTKNFTRNEKKVIITVDQWVGEAMEREKNGQAVFSSSHPVETSKICGISRSSVYNIRKEDNDATTKKTDGTGRPQIKLDDFEKSLLSRLVLGFYKRNPPTVPTLQMIMKEIEGIDYFPKLR